MSPDLPTFIGLGLVLATSIAMSWALLRRKKWRPIGKLSKMYIYPLKSGKYREIEEAECTLLGLMCNIGERKIPIRDRVFVVYNAENIIFTARVNSKMLQIYTEPKDENTVVFLYPGKKNLEISLPHKCEDKFIRQWWDKEEMRVNDCGDEAAEWISEILDGKDCEFRLGYFPVNEGWMRNISHRKLEFQVFKYTRNKYIGAYSELSSYNMLNAASIEDLNSRLSNEDKVKTTNFRPNFVIEGPKAYEEDNWHFIKIGDAVFERFRPCTRCLFTTIDSDTGEKNKNNEPLKTLRKYRTMKMLGEERIDKHFPVLGVCAGLYQSGKVKCGDTVYISD